MRQVALAVLVGSVCVLVLAHGAVAALSVCLNETPGLADDLRAALPIASQAALAVLPLLGQPIGGIGCDSSAPARFMALAAAAYLVGLLVLDRYRGHGHTQWVLVLVPAAVIQLLLLFMPGLLSSDILDYASHGRVAALHSANPYLVPPSAFPTDAFAHQGSWPDAVTVYGPLWTDIDAAIGGLFATGDRVELAIVYKLLALASNVASAALIWWIAHTWQTSAVTAVAMWTWNPLANIEVTGSGHNEGVMIVLMLLAFALLSVRERWTYRLAAMACLVLGALVKFVPAAVALFSSLLWLRDVSGRGRRLLAAALLVFLVLAVSILTAWPWLDSAAVAEPLVNLAAGGQRFKDVWQDAPAAWLTVRVVPLLGVPDDPATLRMDVARAIVWAITRAVFVAYLAIEIWRLLRGPTGSPAVLAQRVALASLRTLLLAILLFVTQVYAWYFLWPLPMACVLGWRERWSQAAVVLGLTFLVAFYLREFQPYGIFYVPIYALIGLAVLAVLRSSERTSNLVVAR